ncbi:MAG: 50S ribosomal protein L18 [Patescibacteria group bacterium]|jgi:large subunit ribosomal protein L18|nr:50S ribosomal protein L18 [Patescibacteria group bacterium]
MNNKEKNKQVKKARRHARVRAKISGTSVRPRISVFKSNKGMFVQLIDDTKGITILSVNSKEIKIEGDKKTKSFEIGKLLAKKAIEKKIEKVVFDKGSFKYHGRIEALANGAREGGLIF